MREALTEAARYRKDALLLSIAVAIAVTLTFAPYVVGGKTLLSSAAEVPSLYVSGARYSTAPAPLRSLDAAASGFQTEPWLAIQHRIMVDEHRLPFWDPYDGYGQPFAAAMQPQPFYPLTALLALHPAPSTYTWFVLARLFLAGFFAALFVRLFADRCAAATAGVATALSGYYLLYYDIPHLSVDTALPMLLWATEIVVRKPSGPRCAALTIAAGLTYLGGMPETALLSITIAALYALVRVRGLETGQLRSLAAVVAGHVTGILAGAIALVPFIDFVHRSFNVHEASKIGTIAGTAHDVAWPRGLLTELAPLAFGYPWSSILTGGAGHSGVRGFFGCAMLLLALIGIAASLVRRGDRTAVGVFFGSVALYCVLKRYGHPLVEWTGTLPGFSLVHFPKYLEYGLGDSLAILAGFGVASLRERAATPAIVLGAFGAALAALSYLHFVTRAEVPPGPYAWQYDAALAIALVALLVAAALALTVVRGADGRVRRLASAALPVAIAAEIFAGYAGPQLWRFQPPAAANPYGGAPYLAYLDTHVDRTRERIFGVSGILFPDWPGAYGLADPRALNALYPQDYLPFIDRFVTTHKPPSDDQFDRFTATRPLQLSAPLVRRWMTLSSVGWLLSPGPIDSVEPPPGGFLTELWAQAGPAIPSELQAAVHTTSVEIDGVAEDALFEHPPNEVRFVTAIPAARPLVEADIALDPSSYAQTPVCGGPVTFAIAAESRGRVVASATRTIDPKHKPSDRHWMPMRLDLSRWANQAVTLRLATAADNLCAAFAVWGEPRFSPRRGGARSRGTRLFRLAFRSPGAYVYQVPGALARLSVYHRARTVATPQEALNALTEPAFDAHREAVVLQPGVLLGSPRGAERVVVTLQRSDEVCADVELTADALLVQNDTFFAGWEATVDGRPAPIVRANFLFRGVAVPGGHHTVRFAYRPRADTLGMLASAAGLLIVGGLFATIAIRGKS
ncbi:MAG: hypothetical protein JWM87_1658 [Candidatus Eremiobacteraeota bacterium]|nr:hypothetical protein [Candidatus Eremiobacteraeota bacterium]